MTHTPDTNILERENTVNIEARIHHRHRYCVGHVVRRLDDSRICKQMLCSELWQGTQPQHKPKQCFEDNLKNHLESMSFHNRNEKTYHMIAKPRGKEFMMQ